MHGWLIVPADSEAKLARVPELGADAIVLDLTGDRSDAERATARERAGEFLKLHRAQGNAAPSFARWIRISALDTPWWRDDLVAALAGAPDGIVLSRAADPREVQTLAAELYELEPRSGLDHGRVRIVPQVGATAAAALAVRDFAGEVHPRLAGLAWDARDLAESLGARRLLADGGGWSNPLARVRADVLRAARARGLMAIDTPHSHTRDRERFHAAATAARADGFTGMLAVHPAQLPVIEQVFARSEEERAEAREIVALFEGRPEASALPYKGRMIDRGRLDEARRLIAR